MALLVGQGRMLDLQTRLLLRVLRERPSGLAVAESGSAVLAVRVPEDLLLLRRGRPPACAVVRTPVVVEGCGV